VGRDPAVAMLYRARCLVFDLATLEKAGGLQEMPSTLCGLDFLPSRFQNTENDKNAFARK